MTDANIEFISKQEEAPLTDYAEPRYGDLVIAKFMDLTYHGIILSPMPASCRPVATVMLASGIVTIVPWDDIEIIRLRPGRETHANFAEILVPPDSRQRPTLPQGEADLEAGNHLREALAGMISAVIPKEDFGVRRVAMGAVMLADRLQRLATQEVDIKVAIATVQEWIDSLAPAVRATIKVA